MVTYIKLVADGLCKIHHFFCLPNLRLDIVALRIMVGVELAYQSKQTGLNRGEKTERPACVA